MTLFAETVSSLLPEWPNLPVAERASVTRRCVDLVHRQVGRSPFHIRLGLRCLLALYYCFALLIANSRADPGGKCRTLEKFSRAPFPFCLALERVLRSTLFLFYFEQPEVLAALGEQTVAERQARFRAMRVRLELSEKRSQAASFEESADELE